jgi:hypothetical protein
MSVSFSPKGRRLVEEALSFVLACGIGMRLLSAALTAAAFAEWWAWY